MKKITGYFLIILFSLWANICMAESIAIIVNPTNQLDSLSISKLARIYKGKKKHWSDGKEITVVNRSATSKIRKLFYKKVMHSEPTKKFYTPGNPIPFKGLIQRSSQSILRLVAHMPGTIGYVYQSELEKAKNKRVKIISIINIEEIASIERE